MARPSSIAPAVALAIIVAMTPLSVFAQAAPPAPGVQTDRDERPYDGQLLRLAEIIGAVHYLRELCGGDEGQEWRNHMRDLVAAEGVSALRRAKLVESFNKGYRGYSRTYRVCNKSAVSAINRFMEQGAAATGAMLQDNR